MVSPIALEIAKTNEEAMPENAAGTMTWVDTSNWVEPKAYAPCRMLFGTAIIASSLKEATIGKVMIPTAILALKALNISVCGKNVLNKGVINVKAK